MEHKVHIAYGFHVNCYHSYRGDTNDKQGFGGDIRIIRKTIKVLNELNSHGIPAKGTWDFENAYSTESILPRYAPDILADIKERTEKYGDENIIMGYNNGALSAMTEAELEASVNWAVTNKYGSGLRDIFGDCQMVVRPQEVMFSPTQVPIYKKLGVKALCLYYSCVPFDAFRTFIPQLSDADAFNPLTYTYRGESITVMPTYSNADLVDAGCLRYLVKDLHKKQKAGIIDRDVLVFINMDADAAFWETVLPKPLNRIANTDGIHGLVTEVADLPYAVFDTVGHYLDTHEPVREIGFGEDTADGSNSGYANWSEKPFNRQIWTRLDRARCYAKLYADESSSPAFEERIRLLSTTHFGLASPVLNIQRENAALELSKTMLQKEAAAFAPKKKLRLLRNGEAMVTGTEVLIDDGFLPHISCLRVTGKGVASFTATALDYYESGCVKTAFLLLTFSEKKPEYELTFTNKGEKEGAKTELSHGAKLNSGALELHFCRHGKILSAVSGGKRIGDDHFLQSYITYDGKKYAFEKKRFEPLEAAGSGSGVSVRGEIHLPGELESGFFRYDFYTAPGLSPVFVNAEVQYPYTKEETEISTETSALGRKTDMRWEESAPFELFLCPAKALSVVKRNFMEAFTDFLLTDFQSSIPENKNLSSLNHQLTGGFVGLSDGEMGLAFVNARQVLGSMAHCPMRLSENNGCQNVQMNPFGTYYGKQRSYPTRGNGAMVETFMMVSPQARSIAPAYNGAHECFCAALLPFEGALPGEKEKDFVCGFADGFAPVDGTESPIHPFMGDNVNFKAIEANHVSDSDLKPAIFSGASAGKLAMLKTGTAVFTNILARQLRAKGKDE